jgi:hypothetical protein
VHFALVYGGFLFGFRSFRFFFFCSFAMCFSFIYLFNVIGWGTLYILNLD